MKNFLISLCLVLGVAMPAFAATDMIPLDKAPNKLNDLRALQNGAKIFVNYCLNCHAAAYMRFNRLKDIGLTDKQIKDNLLERQLLRYLLIYKRLKHCNKQVKM